MQITVSNRFAKLQLILLMISAAALSVGPLQPLSEPFIAKISPETSFPLLLIDKNPDALVADGVCATEHEQDKNWMPHRVNLSEFATALSPGEGSIDEADWLFVIPDRDCVWQLEISVVDHRAVFSVDGEPQREIVLEESQALDIENFVYPDSLSTILASVKLVFPPQELESFPFRDFVWIIFIVQVALYLLFESRLNWLTRSR